MSDDVRIRDSARTHGIADADILHALRNVLYTAGGMFGPSRVLYVGPDRAGNLLEVITVTRDDTELVIHAMKLRRAFEEHLGL